MARLTIYVRDELAEKLRKTKGLNVSAVCQRALEEEVRKRSEGGAVSEVAGVFIGLERELAKLRREWAKTLRGEPLAESFREAQKSQPTRAQESQELAAKAREPRKVRPLRPGGGHA